VKSKDAYKVQIKIGDAEVNVEGAESGVVKIVEALSDVLRGSRKTPISPAAGSISSAVPASTRSASTDIRSFFAEKKPSSDIEAAAAAAYYTQYLAAEPNRRETIDSDSLQEAFRLAKRPLPARTKYTLINARNAGYLDSLGEGGQFRLNAVAYNLVEHGLGSSQPAEKQRPKSPKGRRRSSRK
jgi:hypothetical protein